jgi:hypothetical protein
MKHIKSYKLFEARFLEFREVVSTIKDICQEFEDNNCHCEIFPKDDIKLNVVSLKSRGHLGSITQPFYLEININTKILLSNNKSVNLLNPKFPDWFIENCRRIEDYMNSNGFRTLPNLKYPSDLENFDNVDELEDYPIFLGAKKLVLEFIPNEVPKDI